MWSQCEKVCSVLDCMLSMSKNHEMTKERAHVLIYLVNKVYLCNQAIKFTEDNYYFNGEQIIGANLKNIFDDTKVFTLERKYANNILDIGKTYITSKNNQNTNAELTPNDVNIIKSIMRNTNHREDDELVYISNQLPEVQKCISENKKNIDFFDMFETSGVDHSLGLNIDAEKLSINREIVAQTTVYKNNYENVEIKDGALTEITNDTFEFIYLEDRKYKIPARYLSRYSDKIYKILIYIYEPEDRLDKKYPVVEYKHPSNKELDKIIFMDEEYNEIFTATSCIFHFESELCDILGVESAITTREYQDDKVVMTLYLQSDIHPYAPPKSSHSIAMGWNKVAEDAKFKKIMEETFGKDSPVVDFENFYVYILKKLNIKIHEDSYKSDDPILSRDDI